MIPGLACRDRRDVLALSLICACACTSVGAHETSLMPISFTVPEGQAFTARLTAGDGLQPVAAPHRRNIVQLDVVDVQGPRRHLTWKQGAKLAEVTFPAPAAGVACLAYATRSIPLRMKPKLVDEYLAEIQPGSEILAIWKRQRASGKAWTEEYTKNAKTCLRVGEANAGWPQLAILGQVLELVPLQDPTRLRRGDHFDVVLQHDGQPLPDMALRLFSGDADEQVLRTDAQGQARFDLTQTGRHLIATTRLQPPVAPGKPWTSRWASLGFSVSE